MKKWILLMAVFLNVSELLTVDVFNNNCKIDAHYIVDQISISNTGIITLYFSNDRQLQIPFKFDVKEIHVYSESYFRSFTYTDGQVVEHKAGECQGAI